MSLIVTEFIYDSVFTLFLAVSSMTQTVPTFQTLN